MEHALGALPERRLAPLIGEALGYRRKARLSVKHIPKKEKVLVGFHEKNGRYVANLDSCCILDKSIGEKIDVLSDFFMGLDIKNKLPQVEVAVGDKKTALILRHLEEFNSSDLDKLKKFALEHDFVLYLQPKGLDSIHLFFPDNIDPLLSYRLEDQDITIQFHPHQFIQVNATVNQKMINQALELLDLNSEDIVLDLFCGIGNFTLPIAQFCKHVVGVEGDAGAIEMAQHNAKLNNIDNTEFYTENLFDDISASAWSKRPFTKILLDPPRAGAQEVLQTITQLKPKSIVYISCNPATLARDAKILKEHDYHLKTCGIMDMFPHTKHVEAMTLFER